MELAIFVIVNIIIFMGYAAISKYIVPYLNIRYMQTKLGGIFFFLFCAMTHMELAAHGYFEEPIFPEDMTSAHMMLIHIPQAIAVWAFFLGLRKEIGQSGGKLTIDRNEAKIKELEQENKDLDLRLEVMRETLLDVTLRKMHDETE